MTARRTARGLAAAMLLVFVAAGCGGSGDDKTTAASDPAAGAVDVARAYMTAAVGRDWERVCELTTIARRSDCHSTNPKSKTTRESGAQVGPVLLDRPPTRVHALTAHPEGWAVMVSHTVTWPGKSTTTARTALRVVPDGAGWAVDQREDVFDSDLTHAADPAVAALSRRGSR
ncbi:hypothetical protein [Streptomyces sp. NPDC048606]|uniref:hypothetical protein n=1 Tax=Streptomyces sp. NPDC048606 TaxID=3154726 RepID=UPI00342B296A